MSRKKFKTLDICFQLCKILLHNLLEVVSCGFLKGGEDESVSVVFNL